jgi:hypothetical protein
MPWNETAPMNERAESIARSVQHEEPFAALCESAGIRRKTGDQWVERDDAGGVVALGDRSRAPLSHPHAVAASVVERLLAARRRHPRSGPRTLLAVLRRQEPTRAWPVASTVGDLLRRNGLVRPRRRRCRAPYLSNCLAGELVGLEEVDDNRWTVYCGPIELAVFDARSAKARGMRQFGVFIRADSGITRRRNRSRENPDVR